MLTTCDISRGIACACLAKKRSELSVWILGVGACSCCSHPCQIEANEGQNDPWMQCFSKCSLISKKFASMCCAAAAAAAACWLVVCRGRSKCWKPSRLFFPTSFYSKHCFLTLCSFPKICIINGTQENWIIWQCKWDIFRTPPSPPTPRPLTLQSFDAICRQKHFILEVSEEIFLWIHQFHNSGLDWCHCSAFLEFVLCKRGVSVMVHCVSKQLVPVASTSPVFGL